MVKAEKTDRRMEKFRKKTCRRSCEKHVDNFVEMVDFSDDCWKNEAVDICRRMEFKLQDKLQLTVNMADGLYRVM